MEYLIKQISSLEKIRVTDELKYDEITSAKVLKGERYSYQLAIRGKWALLSVEVESQLKENIKLYAVENAVMDYVVEGYETDDDYITKEPGLMPDILLPFDEKGSVKMIEGMTKSVWIRVDVPKDIPAGNYDIKIRFKSIAKNGVGHPVTNPDEGYDVTKIFTLNVINTLMPEQKTVYSQWFHADCISDYHNVEVYSEKHWHLIEKYIETAVDTGINMLLMPVITPPLDTLPGTARTCVQLVDIKKTGDSYTFNFDKVRRWISICKKYGIKYYEISHLFSQWGSAYSPNILVDVNGEKKYLFTWGIASDSKEYSDFLKCFIPELVKVLKDEGVAEYSYFHISDEPRANHIEAYEKCYNLIKPLIGDIKTCDALSNYEFYKKGLVKYPITCSSHINEFLEHNLPNQWIYYCGGQVNKLSNRVLAMPSGRTRIMGLQMYMHSVKGFLHWGYNFYNSELSAYKINPYLTTSNDGSFTPGDGFSVYPGKDGALLSLRALIFYEGLQDICALELLEKYIGFDAVKDFVKKEANMDITFEEYPRNSYFLSCLRQKAYDIIETYIN
ncbi:MAG: DUF4091 domain-containing protein [Clostridia bacterium]|nr:DUF4091 domain-containing protein [Clostridia bacterium]